MVKHRRKKHKSLLLFSNTFLLLVCRSYCDSLNPATVVFHTTSDTAGPITPCLGTANWRRRPYQPGSPSCSAALRFALPSFPTATPITRTKHLWFASRTLLTAGRVGSVFAGAYTTSCSTKNHKDDGCLWTYMTGQKAVWNENRS